MFLNFEDSLKMSSTDLGLESLSRRNRFLFSTSFTFKWMCCRGIPYESNWLNVCPIEVKPTFYRRYVDDICVLFTSLDSTDSF